MTMLNPKLRKRRQAGSGSDTLLPLHTAKPSPTSSSHGGGRRRRSRKRSWRQAAKLSLACLSVSILTGVSVWRFAWTPFHREKVALSPHASFLHGIRENLARKQWAKHRRKKHRESRMFKAFTCPDGSKGFLNDNYCDCLDGSDETNTSACSNVRVQLETFKCKDGSGMIYASRVEDGIKDCPDGSDENESSLLDPDEERI